MIRLIDSWWATPTMKKKMEEMNLQEWYHKTYPTDDIWTEIDQNATMYDLYLDVKLMGISTRQRYETAYERYFADDSVVRERMLEKLSKIIRVPYDEVLDAWYPFK